MTTRVCAALLSLSLLGAACRLGGPEGSPTELIAIDGGLPPEKPDAAGKIEDAGPVAPLDPFPSDAASGPVDAASPASPDSSITSCKAPADLACDPVSGEGCLPLMQCVVDPSSDTAAAYCLFSGLLLEETCLQDELTTNCPPQFTCVMGECRKYCYCDADCDDGAACAEPSGEGGSDAFRLCDGVLP